jgi:tryptophan 2,3-dioxygenase
MLDEEQERHSSGHGEPLTYGSYLRVPELLRLQTPLSSPPAHDEMLFIILQQIQELWFKEVLYELRAVIGLLEEGNVWEGVRLMDRVNRIMRSLAEQVTLLETMPPQEFHRFRHVLTSSSGLESEQFRELEMASGLEDPAFLKLVDKLIGLEHLRAKWPLSLHRVFCDLLASVDPDPVEAIVKIYRHPDEHRALFALAEALSEYEVRFSDWRFHHIKLVERTIGDRSPGTAGSTGAGYLGKTLAYRFFPELWEARNRMSAAGY